MPILQELTKEELQQFVDRCETEYAAYKAQNLQLDMSRGKPGPDQLDLTAALFDAPIGDLYRAGIRSEKGN